MRVIRRTTTRVVTVGALTLLGALLVQAPAGARSIDSAGSAAPGVVFGGFTRDGWPIAVEVSRNHKSVKQAGIGLELKCGSGYRSDPDYYRDLPLKKRRFHASFGPLRLDYDDGSFDMLSGTASGKANRSWTKMTGKWQLHVSEHNAAGAVTDECESGTVRWTAKQ
jgi:hypothetical protein